MCGIAGVVSVTHHQSSADPRARLEAMLAAIVHRGPDDAGIYLDDNAALGHRRLSIIDLSSAGRQPMSNEDGTIQLVFNGEIYNYPVLKRQLVSSGHVFASHTDTEVLVHGFEEWGLAGLLSRLEGMYAFAIWDSIARKLYLARDQFGIKPLYYSCMEGRIVFGSELKALLAYEGRMPSLSPEGLMMSLQYIGTPAPHTVYQGMAELAPGHWLSFDATSAETVMQAYWRWEVKPDIFAADQARKQLWESICLSVEKNLLADVDVGIFLSGGLDSSLIAAACAELGHKPECLTVAMSGTQRDESAYAAELCRHYGFSHWIAPMDAESAQSFDAVHFDVFDEPFASSAALSAAYVSKTAASKYKVMLSGEGGDELFGGYRWYEAWMRWYGAEGRRVGLWRHPKNALKALLGRRHMPADPLVGYANLLNAFTARDMGEIFRTELADACREVTFAENLYRRMDASALTGLDRLQFYDMQHFLPSICLRKMDRTSMAHSLEVRVPLLDVPIAELVGRIDVSTRNPGNVLKGLLREIAADKLPDSVLSKRKQGFSTPVSGWYPKKRILAEMKADMQGGDWWRNVFGQDLVAAAGRYSGRRLWRIWMTWRWVKGYAQANSGEVDI